MRVDGGGEEPFGRWLRVRVAWLALIAGVVLLVLAIARPCSPEGCLGPSELFILLPALPLVLIGGVTLLGEWGLRRREAGSDDADEA